MFRGGVVLVLVSPLKLSVSIHEMFTGKIGHLTIIKFQKNENSLFFSTSNFLQNKYLKDCIFNDTFCEKIPEFRNLICGNAISLFDLKHSRILNNYDWI